jgi:hypothetical protein
VPPEGRVRRDRFGPALKLAGSIVSESARQREVIMISDFSAPGGGGAEGCASRWRDVDTGRWQKETGNLSVTLSAPALDVLGAGSVT